MITTLRPTSSHQPTSVAASNAAAPQVTTATQEDSWQQSSKTTATPLTREAYRKLVVTDIQTMLRKEFLGCAAWGGICWFHGQFNHRP